MPDAKRRRAKSYRLGDSMETIQKKKKKDVGSGVFIITMLAIPIVSFLFFYVYINFNSILMAFQEPLFDGRGGYRWGFGNFEKFFQKFAVVGTEENMGLYLRNTIIYFCQDMFIMLPLSLIICYFMYKKIAGYQAFRTIIYLPVIMTAPIMASLYKLMLDWGALRVIGEKFGMNLPDSFIMNENYALNSVLFYVLYTGIGGRFVLLGGAMNTIDPSIIDAGKIDGAGPYRELVSIIIPCIWPTLATLILLSSTGIFTASGPLLLFDKGVCGTMSISYYIYDVVQGGGDNTSVELAAAVGVTFTVLALPIVMLVKKITKVAEE